MNEREALKATVALLGHVMTWTSNQWGLPPEFDDVYDAACAARDNAESAARERSSRRDRLRIERGTAD